MIGRGHPAGDFLEAHEWRVLAREPGRYLLDAHLPAHVRNPRGTMFGGFIPTYVDLVAIYTARALFPEADGFITVSLHVDYLEPVVDDSFLLESRVIHSRGKIHLVEVLFKNQAQKLLVFSTTTLRQR